MIRLQRLLLASVVTTAFCLGGIAVADAQSNDQSGPPPQQDSSGPPDQQPSDDNAQQQQQDDQPVQIPVLAVTNVEMLQGGQSGGGDVVRVHGVTGTQGWSNAELFPITEGNPSDGILDLVLVATPADSHEATGFGTIDALLPIDAGHPYKGVRVRSANNAVTVKTVPGSAEAKPPAEDCSKCVGKTFVGKGETAPSGAAAADLVKQEDLPANLRIVRPTDGISDLQSDPNRLTLVIGEDGKILDAAWD